MDRGRSRKPRLDPLSHAALGGSQLLWPKVLAFADSDRDRSLARLAVVDARGDGQPGRRDLDRQHPLAHTVPRSLSTPVAGVQ
jgi:hypothetical protein